MADKDLTPCHKVSKQVLKIFSTELVKQGIEQSLITNALKNVWTSIDEAAKKFSAECTNPEESLADKLKIQKRRKDFFGRIIVHEVGDLFPLTSDTEMVEKIREETVEGKVPREAMYGYITAVKDMFGIEYMEEAQVQLKNIIEKTTDEATGLYDWDKFYDDPETVKIRLAIFKKTKERFEADENIFSWFQDRIKTAEQFNKRMKREMNKDEFRLIFHEMFNCLGDDRPKIP